MLDPNIILQAGRGVTPIESPMDSAMKAMALQNQTLQMQQQRQAFQDQQAMRQLAMESGGDPDKVYQGLMRTGRVAEAQKVRLGQLENAKAQKAAEEQALKVRESLNKMNNDERQKVVTAWSKIGQAAPWIKQAPNPEEGAKRWDMAIDQIDPDGSLGLQEGKGQYDPSKLDLLWNQAQTVAQVAGEGKATGWHEGVDEKTGKPAVFGIAGGKPVKYEGVRPAPPKPLVQIGSLNPGTPGYDDAVEATKKKLLTGQMPFPKGRELADPVNNKAVKLARIEDPTFNEATHAERAKAWNNLSNGKLGQSNNAINTAIAHLGKLTDLYKEIGDTGMVALNHSANWIRKNMPGGYPALDEAETVINAVGDELEKAYTGQGTEGGRKAWREKLDPSLPMASRMRNAIGLVDLLNGKIKANTEQFKKAFKGIDPGVSVLTPESEATLQKIEEWAGKKGGKQAAPAPDAGQMKNGTISASGKYIWSDGQWRLR